MDEGYLFHRVYRCEGCGYLVVVYDERDAMPETVTCGLCRGNAFPDINYLKSETESQYAASSVL